MYEIGRLCVKIAGRDAGKRCVVVDNIDKKFVLVDGETRRKKCNIAHLEPLQEVLKIKKGASHDEVVKVFKEFGAEIKSTKKKTPGAKPTKQRKSKARATTEAKQGKKAAKPKAEKKEVAKKE